MALLNRQIQNLVGGVSQQPDSIRFDSQSEEQINFYPSTSLGLIKRSPSDFIAEIAAFSGASDIYMFAIDRPDGKFICIVDASGDVVVYSEEGVLQEFEVTDGNPLVVPGYSAYLQGSGKDLRYVSIGDSVVLINTNVQVNLREGVITPERDREALIYVTRGEYGRTFKAIVASENDILSALYTTPDGSASADALQTDSGTIATEIANDLIASLAGATDNWEVVVKHLRGLQSQ
jgi:hypothetical protein